MKAFRDAGFPAERTWGSNGLSRGLAEDVDIIVSMPEADALFQAKRRKALAAYMKPEAHHMGVITREDRGESLVVIRLDHLLALLGKAYGVIPGAETNERITDEWNPAGTP